MVSAVAASSIERVVKYSGLWKSAATAANSRAQGPSVPPQSPGPNMLQQSLKKRA